MPNEGLRSFARDVGRELTPPLMTLWNRIEVMLAEARSDQPPSDFVGDLETLHRHAVRMAATVWGLLCMAGEHTFEVRPVDVNALVEDSLSTVSSRLVGRQIEVTPSLDRAIPPVLADTEALRFALVTLIEPTAETSATVDVRTCRAGDGEVQISIMVGRKAQAIRGTALGDSLRLALADAIVRSLGGRLERRGGNPSTTYVLSLRAAGESSTSAGNARLKSY